MTDHLSNLDRRQFAARLAAGAVAMPLVLAAATSDAADEKPNGKPTGEKPTTVKPAVEKPADEKPAPFNPLALQLELLVRRYPSEKLTPEGLRIIASKLASQMAHSTRLNDFPLTNADGPGFVFSAFRGQE